MAACCTAAAYLVMRVLILSDAFALPQRKTSEKLSGISDNITTILKIGGITCSTCSDSIRKGLEGIPGVLAVTVSMVTHEAITKHHNHVSPKDLIAEVESLGYEADTTEVAGAAEGMGNTIEAIEEADRERLAAVRAWRTSFIGASILTLVVLMIGNLLAAATVQVSLRVLSYSQAIFSALVVLFFGFRIHHEAVRAICHGRLDMSLLASLGICLGFFKSMLLLDLPRRQSSATDAPLFGSTAILTSVILGGRFIKATVSRKSFTSIGDLAIRLLECVTLTSAEDYGVRKPTIVPLKSVKRGDYLIIHPGDMVPVDCLVVEGSGYVSQTHISGEVLPVSKSANQNIFAGSTNQNSQFLVKVIRIGTMTWLQRTLRLIIEGSLRKSNLQEVTDLVASKFVAVILGIALATGIWHILGGSTLSESMDKLIAVLLCACPCAIGMASPTAVSIGIGKVTLVHCSLQY
jgi:Cu+-exporting ATPase